MLKRILVANRGEVALRIVRACKHLGLETVAVHTPVDANLPHLDLVDDTVCVSSYLAVDDIVMAGLTRGCDGVHPGYGLLSENADFARAVETSGMTFVGPTPEAIEQLGDKVKARQVFSAKGLAGIPGSADAVADPEEALSIAHDIGFPLVIKAAFGGGGRGIRLVTSAAQLKDTLDLAMGEARVGFGRSEVFIEKFLASARHVEVQVLGDGKGTAVHLGSRDCSVQRRYQKLLEEAPAPHIPEEVLDGLLRRCVDAMSSLAYRNAGTLEFMYEGGEFYFLEANTRLQVEHPVTESIYGRDMVVAQLKVAAEEALPFTQNDLVARGHSIECRILAEDEAGNPGPGTIESMRLPGGPGIRLDSHLSVGYQVPHQYDSLIAKLVSHGESRSVAIQRMRTALSEFKIVGIPTNIANLIKVIDHKDFQDMAIHTHWQPQSHSPRHTQRRSK